MYSSVLEVFCGINYVCVVDGKIMIFEEMGWRRWVFVLLCEYFMNFKEFVFVFELLDKVGDGGEVKVLYNWFFCSLILKKELNYVINFF